MAQGPMNTEAAAVLLMSTTEDKASAGMAAALLRRGGWEEFDVPAISEEGRVWRRVDALQPLYMWQIQQGFLRADFLDRRWVIATGLDLHGM